MVEVYLQGDVFHLPGCARLDPHKMKRWGFADGKDFAEVVANAQLPGTVQPCMACFPALDGRRKPDIPAEWHVWDTGWRCGCGASGTSASRDEAYEAVSVHRVKAHGAGVSR